MAIVERLDNRASAFKLLPMQINWLGDVAHGRENNVRLIRHLAAIAVIYFHCCALNAMWLADPLVRIFPDADLGALGVQVFFALSGFLIAQSWCAHPSPRAYAVARALRVYPALIVAVILTILVSAPSSTLSLAGYFASDMTWTYLWQTSLGISGTLPLAGVFTTNPFPGAANGSLWTLPIELRCYLGILLAGSVGLLRSPRIALVIGLLIITACVYVPWPVSLVLESVNIRKLAIIFTCGTLAYVWRERIPLSLIGGVAAAWAYLTIPAGFVRAIATLPLITYASLAFAYHPRLRIRRLANGADFSYGLYVFAFPIQQLFLWRWPHIGIGGLFLSATPVIAAVAALSWYCVEGPALAMKGRFLRKQAQSPSARSDAMAAAIEESSSTAA